MTDVRQPAAGAGHATASRVRRGALPLALAAAAAGAATLLVVRSPYTPLSYGFCPSVLFLGVSCPGCGGLRATHSLLTGDLAAAWQANPLWTVAAPLLVVAWGVWTVRRLRGRPPVSAPTWPAWLVLVVVVGFAVLRNVPALVPYLGPAPLP
ncbi:DUF2752 domain-containing protein [Cellulomonas sp. KH9]|uniref:DUF2752 domain-containing protein n=1 Tax=Cellulomonas sp. KH9 TaxID=1855324 RepID=UPI0008E5185B|nr:DUF2752 domain-containing protein [Cellulomonas sp. KH9]SFK00266.1 Protein of unknown function [Cellulomonas sp. KH9]